MLRGIALSLVALCAAAPAAPAGEEPPAPARYEGRTAAEWIPGLSSEDVGARKKAAYALWNLGAAAGEAAAALVRALEDADPYVRSTSAKAVDRIGAEAVRPVLPEITALILDSRQEVRREAAALLWRLGPLAGEIVPGLVKGLASTDPVVRANAAGALGHAGAAAEPAAGALAGLLGDREEQVRTWAAQALARIDPPAAFASERAEVRLAALQCWGEMFDQSGAWKRPEIVEGVLRCTKDSNEQVRGWAMHALDNFACFAGAEAPAAWLEIFRRTLEKERVPAIRATAAFGLARYKEHASEVIPLLTAATDCDEPEVERAAILGLGWFREKARPALPAILACFRSGDPETRDAAAVALGAIGEGSEPVIDALVEMLESDSRFGPRNAAASLAIVGKGSARAGAALAAVMNDGEEDPYLRADAARALGEIGGAGALAGLTAWFERDPEAPAQVAGALCKLGSPLASKAIARLAALAADPENPYMALATIRELGPGAAAAVPAVAALLGAPDLNIRLSAASTLQALGPAAKEALPALEAAAKDGNAGVAAAAKRALDVIRGGEPPAR